ncbi:uncharacterized protein LOC142538314 [Primulina tabacum]|uniref:uncharacterized protein LOC142538314 n=1 Tax=Primulina tabacum TaxID=48773 RepID=UPI003F595B72
MAGLKINALKSNIYMGSIEGSLRQDILDITGFTPGILPFRYLGIPLAAKRLCASDYGKLVDNISTKVSAWPRHSLSYAGKLELIRSVIQGVECFWLSILPVPNCVLDSIHAICRKFVWPTKHPPIAWNNLKAWNRALIAKSLWKIHVGNENLWIRWVNHNYSCFGGVWKWRRHKDASPLIKQILDIREEFIRRLGYEEAASLCLQKWFGNKEGIAHAYQFFVGTTGNWPWKPLLSRTFILPKHRFILWLLAHRKLMTRDRLRFINDRRCVLCELKDEAVDHLFFDCSVTNTIWKSVRHWLDMKKIMGSPTAILRAFRRQYRGTSMLTRMRITALAATVYHVWNMRNRVMFDQEKFCCQDIVMKIKIHTYRSIPEAFEVASEYA